MAEPGKRANQIFISYRRDDSAAVTGRIYDRLLQKFGRDVIFKDVDSIPLGVNFRKHLDSIISECAVVLVVIGDRWVGIQDESGRPRLDDPRDFVRIEIESALRREIPVVPLLVHNAEVPDEESLPESLRELADRNGMSIGHDPHFHSDINRLISNLEEILEACAPKEPAAAREPISVRDPDPPRAKMSARQSEASVTTAKPSALFAAPAAASHERFAAPQQAAPAPPAPAPLSQSPARVAPSDTGRVGWTMYVLAIAAGVLLPLAVAVAVAIISEDVFESKHSSYGGNFYAYRNVFTILLTTQSFVLVLGLICLALGWLRPRFKTRLTIAASDAPFSAFVVGLLLNFPKLFSESNPAFPVDYSIFLIAAAQLPAYALGGAQLGAQLALRKQARRSLA